MLRQPTVGRVVQEALPKSLAGPSSESCACDDGFVIGCDPDAGDAGCAPTACNGMTCCIFIPASSNTGNAASDQCQCVSQAFLALWPESCATYQQNDYLGGDAGIMAVTSCPPPLDGGK